MLLSSFHIDSLLAFADAIINNNEPIIYNQETDMDYPDETVSYDELEDESNDLELDLIEDDDGLELDADYLDEQVLEDDSIDNDEDFSMEMFNIANGTIGAGGPAWVLGNDGILTVGGGTIPNGQHVDELMGIHWVPQAHRTSVLCY